MIKPHVSSAVSQAEPRVARCPQCGLIDSQPVFKTKTSLQIYGVSVKNMHKNCYAVCKRCHGVFKLEGK